MASNVALITGASRYLGGQVAATLSAHSPFERLIGLDSVGSAPRELGRTEFVPGDLRHPRLAAVLDQAEVGTVVHAVDRPDLAATVSLLKACARSRTVNRLVVVSSIGVYGANRRDPAVYTETTGAAADVPRGPGRVFAEIEAQVRAFARGRADVTVTVLRLAPLLGPTVDSWLTRYLTAPLAPVPLGFDPRVQVLYETDAVEVVCRVALDDHPGFTNVAGDGVLTLAQVVRRAGGVRVPVPSAVLGAIRGIDAGWLHYGRVVDTARLHSRLGYVPRYSCAIALDAFAQARPRRVRPVALALDGARWAVQR